MTSPEGQGPATIGDLLQDNIRHHRRRLGLTLRELSQSIQERGGTLSFNSLSQWSSGRRQRFDVQDLIDVAVSLDVSPNALFLPREMDTKVALTRQEVHTAEEAWKWANGAFYLGWKPSDRANQRYLRFRQDSQPHALPRDVQTRFSHAQLEQLSALHESIEKLVDAGVSVDDIVMLIRLEHSVPSHQRPVTSQPATTDTRE